MKNILTLLVFLFVSSLALAQVEVELTIENQSVSGTDFFFDLYLTRTSTNPGEGTLNLGNSDFIILFNNGNFNNPTLSKVGSSGGNCTFEPTNNTAINTLVTRITYFNNTAVDIIGNEIIINLNGPTPSDQPAFDEGVAIINPSPNTHRLGTFKIEGISSPNGTAGLTWKTSGTGILTQVKNIVNDANPPMAEPFPEEDATIIAINPVSFPLPVTLTEISANATGQSILVNWRSENEFNLSGYELQRSTDGSDFSKLSFLAASNVEYAQEYRYNDREVGAGVTYYYRLKMIDEDGSFTYSPVRSARIDGASFDELVISPNPAQGHTYVEFNAAKTGVYVLELFNKKGNSVLQMKYELNKGENRLPLNAEGLPSGTYLVKINIGDEVVSGKLILAGK